MLADAFPAPLSSQQGPADPEGYPIFRGEAASKSMSTQKLAVSKSCCMFERCGIPKQPFRHGPHGLQDEPR